MQASRVRAPRWWQGRALRRHASLGLVFFVLVVGSASFLLPLLWMLSTALKSNQEVFKIPTVWIPNPPMWENFPNALQKIPFFLFLRNSIITSLIPVIGALLSACLVAYAFARLKWPGRDVWFIILISTMMLPDQVRMVSTYVIYSKLGWVNTFLPLTVPWFFGSAFYIFMMRQFFMGIPMELSDAALIDGCTHFGILWRIIVPLAKPALATVAIFTFMFTWNSLMGPVIYLTKEEMFTLQIGLSYFRDQHSTQWQELMAASLVVLTPTLLVFFVGQRYFVQGITLTGLKG
jgi:ABC-type glycerol-3-phosphate transport system permease component